MEPEGVASSYAAHQLGRLLYSVAWNLKPTDIVEFGVLEGYSLIAFAQYQRDRYRGEEWGGQMMSVSVGGYDLFEDYPFKHSSKDTVISNLNRWVPGNKVIVEKRGFEDWFLNEWERSPARRLFHLDISNDGDKLKMVLDAARERQNRVGDLDDSWMLVEGGSHERDNVEWMKKFNRPSLREALEREVPPGNWTLVTDEFPSISLIRLDKRFFSHNT